MCVRERVIYKQNLEIKLREYKNINGTINKTEAELFLEIRFPEILINKEVVINLISLGSNSL